MDWWKPINIKEELFVKYLSRSNILCVIIYFITTKTEDMKKDEINIKIGRAIKKRLIIKIVLFFPLFAFIP